LSEAHQLHRALHTLNLYLREFCFVDQVALEKSHFTAFALCGSARFTLYEIYACNEHYPSSGPKIPEEITMQQFSLEGISETIDDVYLLTEHILRFASVSDRDGVHALVRYFTTAYISLFLNAPGCIEKKRVCIGLRN
jgi:hypothetical protein